MGIFAKNWKRFSIANMRTISLILYKCDMRAQGICDAEHLEEELQHIANLLSTSRNTTMVLTLYKLDASPPVRAVYMVIEALNIPDVNYVDVDLLAGDHLNEEYRKLNPQHTVPLLKDDDFLVWDSHAIIGYLVSKYGKNDALYPTDPKKRAIVDQRLHFDSGIIFPSLRGTCEPVFFRGEPAFKPENLEKINKAYQFMENFLTSTWLAGDELTVADICCVANVSSLNEVLPIDEKLYPKLVAWLQKCSKEEFYKKRNEPGLLQFRQLVKTKLGLE